MSARPTDLRDLSSDPTASYARGPAVVRGLTDRLLATSGTSVSTYCPFKAQPLGSIPQSTAADVEEAFRRARRAQEQRARTSVDERQAILLRLHDLFFDRQSEIANLIEPSRFERRGRWSSSRIRCSSRWVPSALAEKTTRSAVSVRGAPRRGPWPS